MDILTRRKSSAYINNSLHLARKYRRIFVRGHYLFREANSFPRALMEENCELCGTDNIQGQISEQIFSRQMEASATVFIILQIFFAARAVLKIIVGNILGYSPLLAGKYSVKLCV